MGTARARVELARTTLLDQPAETDDYDADDLERTEVAEQLLQRLTHWATDDAGSVIECRVTDREGTAATLTLTTTDSDLGTALTGYVPELGAEITGAEPTDARTGARIAWAIVLAAAAATGRTR